MPTLSTTRIRDLLSPYLSAKNGLDGRQMEQFSLYLDLLLKWNARTNLTAIRNPEEIVQRHFGESLFAASLIPTGARTLLDLGSGAGFPGIPMQIARPALQITLAESQGKKAAFLGEACRVLGLTSKVWANRAEALAPTTLFDIVAFRAVDRPEDALAEARRRLAPNGCLVHLTTSSLLLPSELKNMYPLPGSSTSVVAVTRF